jgi:broad specificity phosphatase PhoE
MKVIFMRHAESVDDLTDQYGGWLDLELTPHGRDQVTGALGSIAGLSENFEQILHSPLKRAAESAQIVSEGLSIPARELVYLKEKNGYGLLTGLVRSEAHEKYPELVADFEAGYVFGAEPEASFAQRVQKAYQLITETGVDTIAVTHGGFLKCLFEQVFDLHYIKAHDAGFVLWDTEQRKILSSSNFEFEEKS